MPCLHAGLAPAFFIRAHSFGMQRLTSLLLALALHAIVLWGLWQHRLIPTPGEAMTLFVDFIAPAAPEKPSTPPPQPAKPKPVTPKPVTPPAPRLVAETPVVAPTDYVAPPPPPEPAPRIDALALPPAPPVPPTPLPAGPVTLGEELSVACPERRAPAYPAISRRLGEEGTVVLRVELDQAGSVVHAEVKASSGFARLDEAALTAVKTWRCQPARRNGQPVRAVALQPFKFVLQ